ncbi:MAG TPA: alpha/beta hydrolase [Cryptosporangiaceae bacterium]|nr:alpha/beta hydrolase [Cryptosporangiaceae bacterium]
MGKEYVAIEPVGARRLADLLEEAAGELHVLRQRGRDLGVDAEFSLSPGIARWLAGHAAKLRHAAAVVEVEIPGPLEWARALEWAGLPLGPLPNPAAARALVNDLRRWLAEQPADATPEARARAVAAWLGTRTWTELATLAVLAPTLVGTLDGAPTKLRYAANRLTVARTRVSEQARLEAWRPPPARSDPRWVEYSRLTGRLAMYDTLLTAGAPDVLTFEPPRWDGDRVVDDGRLAVTVGDLDTASAVPVVVPGAATRIDTFGGYLLGGQALRTASAPGTAVVVWLGYDAPGFSDAVLTDDAERGGVALHGFLAGLQTNGTVTVVGHSYGSLVAAYAMRAGARPDRLVVLGSPGLGRSVDHATDLGLPPGYPVFAMRTPDDLASITEWHGRDPVDLPGARPLDSGTVTGHVSYFTGGALTALAAVVAGDPVIPPLSGRRSRHANELRELSRRLVDECPPEVVANAVARVERRIDLLLAGGEVHRAAVVAACVAAYRDSGLSAHLTPAEFAWHLARSGLVTSVVAEGAVHAVRLAYKPGWYLGSGRVA